MGERASTEELLQARVWLRSRAGALKVQDCSGMFILNNTKKASILSPLAEVLTGIGAAMPSATGRDGVTSGSVAMSLLSQSYSLSTRLKPW